jgi:hypothetical protein
MLVDLVGFAIGVLAVVGGYRVAPYLFRSLILAVDETAFSAKDRRDLEERFRQVAAEYDFS